MARIESKSCSKDWYGWRYLSLLGMVVPALFIWATFQTWHGLDRFLFYVLVVVTPGVCLGSWIGIPAYLVETRGDGLRRVILDTDTKCLTFEHAIRPFGFLPKFPVRSVTCYLDEVTVERRCFIHGSRMRAFLHITTPHGNTRLYDDMTSFARIANLIAPQCASCGYDLRGNVSARCPECGRACDPDKLISTDALT